MGLHLVCRLKIKHLQLQIWLSRNHRQDFIQIGTSTQDVLYDMTKDFRPETPKHQSDFFPITPDTTPFTNRTNIQQTGFSRTADSSPTRRDPQLTIKASQAMQRGGSYQDNFATMRRPTNESRSFSASYCTAETAWFGRLFRLPSNVIFEYVGLEFECLSRGCVDPPQSSRMRCTNLETQAQGMKALSARQ